MGKIIINVRLSKSQQLPLEIVLGDFSLRLKFHSSASSIRFKSFRVSDTSIPEYSGSGKSAIVFNLRIPEIYYLGRGNNNILHLSTKFNFKGAGESSGVPYSKSSFYIVSKY